MPQSHPLQPEQGRPFEHTVRAVLTDGLLELTYMKPCEGLNRVLIVKEDFERIVGV